MRRPTRRSRSRTTQSVPSDAEAFDEVTQTNEHESENGAAAGKMLEVYDEVSKEDVEVGRLIEERRDTSKGEKRRLKDLSKQIRKFWT